MKFLALIFVLGCSNNPPDKGTKEWRDGYVERAAGMTYFRDDRTGLCFAYLLEHWSAGESSWGGPGLAAVPCDKVEHLLANGAEGVK